VPLPYVTRMVNGLMPHSQKHAMVTPLLKSSLDTTDMNNYRLVSNLSFMSKFIERVVANQHNEYLSVNNLIPRFQSAYRKDHSTDTALLRVSSDMLMAADDRKVTLLMSAAFDCVDHPILLDRLRVVVGIEAQR